MLEVAPVSRLYDERVRAGSVVTGVNGKPGHSSQELEAARAAAPPGSYLRLYVHPANPRKRGGRPFYAVTRVP